MKNFVLDYVQQNLTDSNCNVRVIDDSAKLITGKKLYYQQNELKSPRKICIPFMPKFHLTQEEY